MTHLEEGRLLELRDDARGEYAEAWRHLDGCAACADALEEARGRSRAIEGALDVLDAPTDLERARAAVRARVAAHTAAASGTPSVVGARSRKAAWSLSRAAGILLVTAAGAAAALPSSPVRAWVASILGSGGDAVVATEEPAAASDAAALAPETPGIRVTASTSLQVSLRGWTEGAELRIVWVPGSEAAVFAPTGSRFTTGAGRVEADLADGAVRVEIPSEASRVELVVDGAVFLRRSAAGLEVMGPVASRGPEGMVFVRAPR